MAPNILDKPTPPADAARGVKPVAVIDIGTASVRMAIAEINPAGEVRRLETLAQAVNLGKDSFTRGHITKATIEDCVQVLRSYRRLLEEYGITRSDQIRVVATSAVREAENRLAFVDRIYSATGLDVEVLDEAEVSRITYQGVQTLLQREPELAATRGVVIEVGGGSTELLLVQGGDILYAHTYRLGSLRLRETLETFRAPADQFRAMMEADIERTVEEIIQHLPLDEPLQLLALGGDVRLAASRLLPEADPAHPRRLPLDQLEKFTSRVLAMTEDELVRKLKVTFPEAETLGPALLTYLQLARSLRLGQIVVTNVNLRDGLLEEMAAREAWTEEFRNQIVRSAIDLGRKFQFDEDHCRHVAELSKSLFRALKDEHHLDQRYELILEVAALLHDVGLFISNRSYHKHTMYLIIHSELFGLGKQDIQLVGLVARYHRRASPKPLHEGFATLDREKRVAVAKLAALLRIADALDRSHSQRVREIRCTREEGRLVISIPRIADLSLEQLALKQKGPLFEEIFGMQVLLRPVRA